jgi:hypothetical protein
MEKIDALAKYLECGVDDLGPSPYDSDIFASDNQEYLVLTDEEADLRCSELIQDSLWAFRFNFISSYLPNGFPEEAWKALTASCESSNEAIKAMMEGVSRLDDLIQSAIGLDGRGHFLSLHDGEENQEGEYYIYRTD